MQSLTRPRKEAGQSRLRRCSLMVVSGLSITFVLLTACSGPGSGDDDPTSTSEAQSATTTPTEVAAPTEPASNMEPTAAASVTVELTATLTESPTPTTTDTGTTATLTPTPTEVPLPAAGAELLILGKPILKVISGNRTGEILYAVTDAGMSRSNNGGVTWVAAGEVQDGVKIVSLTSPDILYAGDRAGCGRGFSFFDFVRSFNSGLEWDTIAGSVDIQPMIAFEAGEAAYVYGTDCGVKISDDAGDTWIDFADLAGEEIFSIDTDQDAPNSKLLVVGVTEGGTGRLFVIDIADPLAPELDGAIAQFFGNAAVAASNGRIVVATSTSVGISDDGETWTWSRNGLEDVTYSVDPLIEEIPAAEQDKFFGFTIAEIDPANRDRIWVAGSHGAYESNDAGATWTRIGDVSEIDGLVVSTFASRVFVSSDGETHVWTVDGN